LGKQVDEDSPVMEAFQLMRDTGVGGVPVVANASMKLMGNISARDLQFLLSTPEIFKSYSLLTAGNFLEAVRTYLQSQGILHGPLPNDPVSCTDKSTLLEIITKLDEAKIHRIYVLNPEGDLKGVVTLRDIISTFVEEPLGYFKDFFAGVVPATAFA
jgi:CBS domain-containing protein